jgi:hypothetical protein
VLQYQTLLYLSSEEAEYFYAIAPKAGLEVIPREVIS